jgi:hypothetical protein
VAFDVIVSKETTTRIELAGFGGFEVRGQPDDFDARGGAFRWGAGVGFPLRSPLRGIFELTGNVPSADSITFTGPRIQSIDNSLPPLTSSVDKVFTANAGLTWQHRNGFFIGGGIGWNFPTESRDAFRTDDDSLGSLGDFADWQVRLGFHPGVRFFVAPPAPPPPPPPPPPPAPNRPPTVQARCEACTIEVGRQATVTADAKDPDATP